MMHVQRSKGELCKPKNTVASFKHDGGSIVFWGCFAASGTSTMHLNGLPGGCHNPPGSYAPVPNAYKKLVLEWIK